MYIIDALQICPLIAILRGVHPAEVVAVGQTLIHNGFTCIEVPLNSPINPYESLYVLSKACNKKALIGAGTVYTREQVLRVKESGAQIVVMPHTDVNIIHLAKENGLYCVAGFHTPTEAFTAIQAGADALKFFPATSPAILKAIVSILPKDTPIFAVGGINPESMEAYKKAGAAGFGLGAALYKPGDDLNKIAKSASMFYDTIRHLS